MKKIITVIIISVLFIAALAGCGAPSGGKARINITAAAFPEYDWLRNLTEGVEGVEITLLLDTGVDLHSYQPTAKDMVKVANSDMFVYVGGESEKWADNVKKTVKNDSTVCISLLSVLGDKAKIEEAAEGMQKEEHEEDGEEAEYDEHVWLSLKNAALFCKYIEEKLAEIDPLNRQKYKANLDSYTQKLNGLDSEYENAAAAAKTKTLLFADRFPFRYLVDDYGLSYYAAFSGCSAESEASFETILFLANKIDELGLHAIVKIETSDGKIAETVKNNTKTKDQKTVTLNSLQSVTLADAESGVTYISVMENNLAALKEALG